MDNQSEVKIEPSSSEVKCEVAEPFVFVTVQDITENSDGDSDAATKAEVTQESAMSERSSLRVQCDDDNISSDTDLQKEIQKSEDGTEEELTDVDASRLCVEAVYASSTAEGDGILKRKRKRGENRQICEYCGKGFPVLSRLKKHSLIHATLRPHKCVTCEKTFKRLPDLRTHLLTHDDRRPFSCDLCGKHFKRLSDVRIHHSTHEDKRPYTCDYCAKGFKWLSGLREHMLIHDDKRTYKCSICDKTFKRLSDVKRHYLTHQGVKSFKCDICDNIFKRFSAMKKHRYFRHERKKM